MIGRISGQVVAVRGERATLEVGGIGYEVWMTAKAVAALPAPGEPATIHTHLHVREDDLTLYGFGSEADRDLFRVLLGASGVGPKVALAMLGVFSAEALKKAVAAEDVDALTQVPGVGKRSAQRIVLDLKPRLAELEAEVLEGGSEAAQLRQALENLGYAPAEIREVVPLVDDTAPLAEQIRQALKELAR